jgi:hypothetical protein
VVWLTRLAMRCLVLVARPLVQLLVLLAQLVA